jgi:SAM-dependent methyltransferase
MESFSYRVGPFALALICYHKWRVDGRCKGGLEKRGDSMRPDASELSEFYAGPLGSVARRLLAHRIRTIWPNVQGDRLLGVGYAAPFMRQFRQEAARQLLCMPREQGAVRWPSEGPTCSFLASEVELPLANSSVDRVLAVHCLEHCGASRLLLRELWRVLTPEGRLLLVVPNRRGVWARFDSTPFGHGHPYSRGPLQRLLTDCLYEESGFWPALFMPPLDRRLVLNTAIAWERIGIIGWAGFAGVMVVEAQKQVYAPIDYGQRVRARAKMEILPGKLAASRQGAGAKTLVPAAGGS